MTNALQGQLLGLQWWFEFISLEAKVAQGSAVGKRLATGQMPKVRGFRTRPGRPEPPQSPVKVGTKPLSWG